MHVEHLLGAVYFDGVNFWTLYHQDVVVRMEMMVSGCQVFLRSLPRQNTLCPHDVETQCRHVVLGRTF